MQTHHQTKSQAFTLWALPSEADVIRFIAGYYTLTTLSIGMNSEGFISCRYHGDKGRECAFALVCAPGVILEEEEGAAAKIKRHGTSLLQYRFQHIASPVFWSAVQSLHDCLVYWTETGLSDKGKCMVETLLCRFSES